MNMVTIKCPKCDAEGKLSLVEPNYVGPRRCWKCRELFTITIINNQLRDSEPLSEEDYEKQLEAKKASDKMGNFNESPRQRDFEKPATKSPPDRFRTFVPLEPPGQKEPPKPASKNPPDKFRTFIPPAT
jgi:Zn ribbon nucleic-acid-binding protein